eukprot:scaffold139068_cov193-Phaeocystis_antarctica.AAC.1
MERRALSPSAGRPHAYSTCWISSSQPIGEEECSRFPRARPHRRRHRLLCRLPPAYPPQMTKASVASKLAEANHPHPVALPSQWLPVLLAAVGEPPSPPKEL